MRGAVQVPRGGLPIMFGSDHPVTGGYPVIAVVDDADVDRASQARPGQPVRFRQRTEPRVDTPVPRSPESRMSERLRLGIFWPVAHRRELAWRTAGAEDLSRTARLALQEGGALYAGEGATT